MDHRVFLAFFLTLLAGLSTGIGSGIAFLCRSTNRKFLSVSLGFSAGVMIYVSLVEIMGEARETLVRELGTRPGSWATVAAFFGGMLVIAVIDKLIPEEENPHEVKSMEGDPKAGQLMRMGVFTALAIAIHNFPEGLSVFVTSLEDVKMGAAIAFAITLHNIPEGISVALPIYNATGDKKRAFWIASLSGLAEPAGAVAAYLVFAPVLTPAVVGGALALTAGIMVYISLDELLPMAKEYGQEHYGIFGVFAGMAFIAIGSLAF